jgi:riboflavin transporter FmnP
MSKKNDAKTTETQNDKKRNSSFYHIYRITLIGILSAVAFGLMKLEFPMLFIAPEFYKMDFSELPVIIGTFALGPISGVIIELLKNLLNVLIDGTATAFVGEFANFAMGVCYILPAGVLYYFRKTKKTAIVGLSISTVCCVVLGCFLNAYVLLPMYSRLYFKDDIELIIEMGTKVHSIIKDVPSFVIFAVAPFNLIKYGAASLITILIYKRISRILKNPMERA